MAVDCELIGFDIMASCFAALLRFLSAFSAVMCVLSFSA